MKTISLFLPSTTDQELTEFITRRIAGFGATVQLPEREKILEGNAATELESCNLVAMWVASDDKHNRLTDVIRLVELLRREKGSMPIVFYHPAELAPKIRRYMLSLAVSMPNGQGVEDFLMAIEALLQIRNIIDIKVPA